MNDPNPSLPQNTFYKASFLRRTSAYFIDFLIFVIIFFLTRFSLAILMNLFNQFKQPGIWRSDLMDYIEVQFIAFFTPLLFNILLIWKKGFTLGKKFLKLEVKSSTDKTLGFWRVLLRETVGKIASFFGLGLGYFWSIWDKEKQTWHDKLARTLVLTSIFTPEKVSKPTYFVLGFLITLQSLFLAGVFLLMIFLILGIIIFELNTVEQYYNVNALSSNIYSLAEHKWPNGLLCNGQKGYCEDNYDSTKFFLLPSNGSAWLKINFKQAGIYSSEYLPYGLSNKYSYRYCANSDDWEINMKLKKLEVNIIDVLLGRVLNKNFTDQAVNDKGDDSDAYEVGSDLTVCKQN